MEKLNSIQFQVLSYVVNNKTNNCTPPDGMSSHIYNATLGELDSLKLIHVAWESGHKPVAIRIFDEGYAVLEVIKQEMTNKLENILEQYGLDMESYKVLVNLDNDEFYQPEIEDMSWDTYEDIMDELEPLGLIAYGETKDDPEYRITRKGKKVLQEISKDMDSDEKEQPAPNSESEVYIKSRHQTDVMKAAYALCRLGIFVDADGVKIDDKKVMNALSIAFNEPAFNNYSAKLSSSKSRSNQDSFVEIGEDITKTLRDYYIEENAKTQK